MGTGSSETRLQKLDLFTKMLLPAGLRSGPLPPTGKSFSPDGAGCSCPGSSSPEVRPGSGSENGDSESFWGHPCPGPPSGQVAATRAALAPEVVARRTAQVPPALWAQDPVWRPGSTAADTAGHLDACLPGPPARHPEAGVAGLWWRRSAGHRASAAPPPRGPGDGPRPCRTPIRPRWVAVAAVEDWCPGRFDTPAQGWRYCLSRCRPVLLHHTPYRRPLLAGAMAPGVLGSPSSAQPSRL